MRIPLIIFHCILSVVLLAQQKVIVYFKDKGPDATVQLQNPEKFLSLLAIERHMICNSPFDMTDVPVSESYLHLLSINNCKVQSASKWLNAVLVNTTFENIHVLLQLPMVSKIEIWNEYNIKTNNIASTQSLYNYGASLTQIKMLNLDQLHDSGYTGKNILMLVCDAGFNSVNSLNAFQYLRQNNRIKATRDYVANDNDVYADDVHGEYVFSILAAKVDAAYIGSAFDANFMLARTENSLSETHSEEYNWVLAAEWADSAGVKIIQSSISYNNFDAGVNYSAKDMDGRTAIITQGAVMATRKGIVIVNSAGNEGDNSFQKITAPADADSILAVGSVNASGIRLSNSSMGPTGDNRIKPDVMAMGGATAYINNANGISYGSGTSYASPLVAGLCACLMQKYKYVTNIELINAVKRSADRYSNPDTLYGYGIPNALIADSILRNISLGRGITSSNKNFENLIKNTLVSNQIKLNIIIDKIMTMQIYNASGKLITDKEITTNSINITELASGNYYLKLNGNYIGKFVKY